MAKKINLLFDTTNMFHRSLFTASMNYGGGSSESYDYSTQLECDQLMRQLCADIALVIRQTKPDRVMFCKDTKSWRKDIEIV